MAELVIRIDPARVLRDAYARTHARGMSAWRYAERQWRVWRGRPVVVRLADADRRTSQRMAVAMALVVALVFALAWRGTPATVAQGGEKFEDKWGDTPRTEPPVRQIDLSKKALEPKPVKTERILPEAPAPAPAPVPPAPPVQEDPPPPMRKRAALAERPVARVSNVCTRHHMRKVITNGGRSWRCRR